MKHILGLSLLSIIGVSALHAIELPLTDVTIFSSGVAFYEHKVKATNSVNFELTFDNEQIDDFLKSVAVSDPGAKKITLEYDSSETLDKTLQSFAIDMSKRPTLFELLKSQIGSEISVVAGDTNGAKNLSGRLLSVERSSTGTNQNSDIHISLVDSSGIYTFALSQISQFNFSDKNKNDELLKALTLLDDDIGNRDKKKVIVKIEGTGNRDVKLSYVLGAPVWKTTYRLLLGNNEAVFQAWAIVDNSTNFDWEEIKLNLITGKPVSFRQDLYEPYYITRPTIDLPVEGAAKLEMYESGVATNEMMMGARPTMKAMSDMAMAERYIDEEADDSYDSTLGGGVFSASSSVQADTKFVFTPNTPISIERQKSMMIPLKVTTLPAKKMTVFSNLGSMNVNPKLCVELTNTSGLNLPAGAITLYDEGYSGDSMIAFLPKDEKRLISYGDDLLLSGRRTTNNTDTILKMSAVDGYLKVETERLYTATYFLKNSDSKARTVILEHPINYDSTLYKTDKPIEQTSSMYRFQVTIPANSSLEYAVNEKRTLSNQYSLLIESTLNKVVYNYVNTGKAPSSVVSFFKKVSDEKQKVEDISEKLSELQSTLQALNNEQDRTRKNMEALAGTSEVGNFTKKLLQLEDEIVSTTSEIEKTKKDLDKQKKAYNDFLKTVKL